ncbi:SusC/RagA family TonB-linked outer membrane protein [Cytophagales bacterium WSM2-2]|nr:SusC/RagA family TonB-linked outer membrane protein [Cytophagales bacterium WSM2-2]
MIKVIQRYFFLVVVAVTTQAFAQSTLSGTVKSQTGETLIGVNVLLKNSGVGTVTDMDGKFILQVNNAGDGVLVFTYIGYAPKEVPVNNQATFEVTLIEDAKTLEEVVVTGYQSEERKKILGAVNTIAPELLTKIPVSGIDQALQGRIPGVAVTQNTGAPGEGVIVRIRGVGSLNSNNQPLYIIDGIPTLDATFVAPQDIQSLTVLKDASAAALYGARAANGVILISTKMGTSNKPMISYSSQVGVQSPTRLVPMASTSQYVSIYNEAANNDNPDFPAILQRPLISPQLASTLPNVDQVGAIFRPNAVLQTHSLTISGGEGKTRYFLSGSYYKQEGTIKSSDYTRFTGRMNIESEVKKWLKAGINLNASDASTDLVGSSGDGAGGNGGSVIRYAYFRSPAVPIYDSAGGFVDKPTLFNFFGDGYNPVGMLAYNQNKRITDRLFGKFYVVLKPIEGLTITSNFGIDFTSQNQRRFDRNWGTPSGGIPRINSPNRLTVIDDRNHTLTFSNFATYTKSFGQHGLTILAGTEAIQTELYEVTGTDTQFANQTSTLVYLGNGLGLKTNSETRSRNALLSYFGKASYDYNEKYLASATIRRDGSSRFGPANRYGTFYAGSLGWRIDKESFLVNNTWIDKLMVRAGYGVIGNQEIPNYAFSDAYGVNYNYPFGNARNVGYAVSQLGNANVKWESSSQFNYGVDLVTGNGKLSVSLDYFNKITSDLLNNQPIATSAGMASPPIVNNGKILNRGLELSLNYTGKVGDFNYSISPNAALIHNEVLAVNSPIAGGQYGAQYVTQTAKGHPVGAFYMYEMEGIFQNATDIFTHAVQGPSVGPSRIQPGDVKFKDQDGSGTIDGGDRAYVGSAIPKVTAGLNLTVNYKRFDLSVFFQGAYGQKILSVLNRDIEGFYRPFNVTERYFQNHWTGEGSTNQYPRASWNASGNNTQISTRFLEDGSYTRLKNIQIGYSVPKVITDRYRLSSVRIYFSGTNLFTFTKYSGMDPEMSVSNNSVKDGDKANGIDWGTYPAAKSYNVGVNISF